MAVWFQITNNKPSKKLNSSSWPLDGTQTSTTILTQSRFESNYTEGYSMFPKIQDWSLTIRCCSCQTQDTKWLQVLLT